jgi:hypothetical protein
VIRQRMTGERWFVLYTAGWILVDATALEDQLLTDAAHRLLARHPVLWQLAVGMTALHLVDGYKRLGIPLADPYTHIGRLGKRGKIALIATLSHQALVRRQRAAEALLIAQRDF